MPLWLDLLRTPMAAPETPELRRDRRTWQLLCGATALMLLAFDALHRAIGNSVAAVVAALLIVTVFKTVAYVARKKAADDAYLDAVTGEGA
ncbi:hypothetical protein [Sphingomonas xinjiangensis]|uniref:Putative membrane protein n=1 Tax=Sphingomonas xinjiangensis TaxID=643568 RepID=A0A840YLT2_9SPHN|nr:hypothetical protein [Sphingomonas xinjiangensis]MBB5712348.1 putative membrane protein [Sphingomonas xinjiangensis]